jgi:phenylpropionate dioxygenase-like ring-hydroxylating dioxygenase large terminal subunit
VLFGTMASDAEPLEAYLGKPIIEQVHRWCGRKIKVLGYTRQRIQANWKLYAENTRDHSSLLHEFLVTFGLDRVTQVGGVTMDTRHRHNITWSEANSDMDDVAHAAYADIGVRSDYLKLQEPDLVAFPAGAQRPSGPRNRICLSDACFCTNGQQSSDASNPHTRHQ